MSSTYSLYQAIKPNGQLITWTLQHNKDQAHHVLCRRAKLFGYQRFKAEWNADDQLVITPISTQRNRKGQLVITPIRRRS